MRLQISTVIRAWRRWKTACSVATLRLREMHLLRVRKTVKRGGEESVIGAPDDGDAVDVLGVEGVQPKHHHPAPTPGRALPGPARPGPARLREMHLLSVQTSTSKTQCVGDRNLKVHRNTSSCDLQHVPFDCPFQMSVGVTYNIFPLDPV